jgi:hypothetical protein
MRHALTLLGKTFWVTSLQRRLAGGLLCYAFAIPIVVTLLVAAAFAPVLVIAGNMP